MNVGMRSHDGWPVRMAFRKKRMEYRFIDDTVGSVLHRLAALVADDVLLIRKRLLIERVEQIAHPVGMDPQSQLELVRRQRVEIIGAIE